MTISNGYVTLAEMRGWVGITDSTDVTDDARLEWCVEAASRQIDRFCGRHFYVQTAATRYFTGDPDDGTELEIDDLTSVTTLQTDEDDDYDYDYTWSSSTDYMLWPFNANAYSEPYTKIKVMPVGNYLFPTQEKSVKIVGTFGWPSVPSDVKAACMILATRLYMRKGAPLGVAGIMGLSEARIVPTDPDLAPLLGHLRKIKVGAI